MHSYDLPLSATSYLTCGSYMITHIFLLFSLFFSSTFIRKFCIHLIICILIKRCLITMRVCVHLAFHFLHYFAFLSCLYCLLLLPFFPSFLPSIHPPLDLSIIFFFIFLPFLFNSFDFVQLPKNGSSSFLSFLSLFLSHLLPSFLLTSFYFFFFVYYPLQGPLHGL